MGKYGARMRDCCDSPIGDQHPHIFGCRHYKGNASRKPVKYDDADYYKPDASGYSRADEEWFFDMDGKP